MASYPPPTVLAQSLEGAGEQGEAPADLVVSTGLRIVDLLDLLDLLDRLERAYRPRTELIEDRYAVESLSADVPALTKTADWLLGQSSLREAPSQQLRAVLEPDITDYLRDLRSDGALLDVTVPALDAPRRASDPGPRGRPRRLRGRARGARAGGAATPGRRRGPDRTARDHGRGQHRLLHRP
ncbi:hypothetical protein [Streptomyces sp. NBC_00273]|uniref:hypothetical protein n=1 Tax=Streptomyces sp. NBC_00273 TaxID=2903644 RepID=UPI002E2B494D|nr:hypothetical protein [Streptomyces sp. NBC_00273]